MNEIKVPDIGGFDEVDVIEILVQPGDRVAVEDALLTLESDKASMDVPSPIAGLVTEIKVRVGDKVSEGHTIMMFDVDSGSVGGGAVEDPPREAAQTDSQFESPPLPRALAAGASAPPPPPHRAPPVSDADQVVDHQAFKSAHASPALRRFARDLGVDLAQVEGTGRKGRIVKEDVQEFIKRALSDLSIGQRPDSAAGRGAGMAPIPAVDFEKFGAIEEQPLSRIKKISGAHLRRCWLNLPMVTYDDEADVTELEAFRQALKPEAADRGARVTTLSFITKVLGAGLHAFPRFNASLSPDGESLILKKYVNVGIAVDTPDGLVVPVIKGVDTKGVFEIAADMAALSVKARDGKLSPADLSGGCMSISSLGGIGGTGFTPLVNAPEVAILGLTRARMKPVWNGEEFVPRLLQPLHVTFDHRVVDGAEAARFTTYLCQLLGDLKRLVL